MNSLTALKTFVVNVTGLTRPELHLVVGTILFIAAFALLRRPLLALAGVFLIELANEANDYRQLGHIGPHPVFWLEFWGDSIRDVLWTGSVPVLLALAIWLVRRRRHGRP